MEMAIMISVAMLCVTVIICMAMLIMYSMHESRERRQSLKELLLMLEKHFDDFIKACDL
jgi:hypothetical protein